MAVNSDSSSGKDDVKTQFVTREGTYRLMPLSEYSRPNRVGYTTPSGASQVRVSLVTLPPGPPGSDNVSADDRICFNHGKELYVYIYRGIKKAADLTKPVDKKLYKGTNPTCHDFNTVTMTPDSVSLVIGFSTGQIQLIDPIKKELSKLYNEERLIDKTKATCIKWVPGSSNLFLVAHSSGQLYVYNEELTCGTTAPHYQLFKQGDGFSIYTCRTKSTRNPLYRWVIGPENNSSSINEFAFSPCGTHLAVVSQDGFLRVFHYDTMELVGRARSYFGGFLCLCWSPDSRYIVVGGEDDLVTIWSFSEKRVVARGQGHRSWVSVVAFDPYVTTFEEPEPSEDSEKDSEGVQCYYRLGSVSQDTQMCLWDLTEDILRPPVRGRASAHLSPNSQASFSPNGVPGMKAPAKVKTNKVAQKTDLPNQGGAGEPSGTLKAANSKTKLNNVSTLNITVGKSSESTNLGVNSITQRLAGFTFGERREHRRNFSLTSKPDQKASGTNSVALRGKSAGSQALTDTYDPLKLIGTPSCPRFDECPVLEPLVCKKLAHERLTALIFRSDCFLTACADGCVYTWARPARAHNGDAHACRNHRRFDRLDLVD